MHKILFITRIFPPSGGSAVQAPTKLVKYLPDSGVFPHVVTGPPVTLPFDESLLREIPPSVPVSVTFSLEPAAIQRYLTGQEKSKEGPGLFLKAALRCYAAIYSRIAFPDQFMGWVPFCFMKCASLIRKKKLQVIYANGQPPSSMLVGFLLKKLFNLPLIIDYTDPWMATPGYYPQKRITARACRFLEKRFLDAADLVLYCKKSILDDLLAAYAPGNTRKFIFTPLGYDPADFPPLPAVRTNGKFRIVYTGKLTGNFCYSPRSFFEALRMLLHDGVITPDSVEVICAGLIAPEYRQLIKSMKLEAVVSHRGYVDHRESVALLQSADCLLLLIESEKGRPDSDRFAGSLPAKLFEYMHTGKPILAVIPPGYEYETLQKSGLGIFAAPNDPDSVKTALEQAITAFRSGTSSQRQDRDFINSFDRQAIAAKLADRVISLIQCGTAEKEPAAEKQLY